MRHVDSGLRLLAIRLLAGAAGAAFLCLPPPARVSIAQEPPPEVKMADVPSLFRVILQVSDLDEASAFYSKLLGATGRRICGARHYFDCGPVILALVDPAGEGEKAKPNPDYIYFSVADLESVHERARALRCLSPDEVHGARRGTSSRAPGESVPSTPRIPSVTGSASWMLGRCSRAADGPGRAG